MLSIIIPARDDPCLQKTIDDIRKKSEGEVEIVVVLDGKEEPVDDADLVIVHPETLGMRTTVNDGMEASSGEYVMKCDSHIMFDQGFDVKLLETIEDDWVVIPIRYELDIDKWERMDGEPIVYDRLVVRPEKIGGVRWRRKGREHIKIDETMTFQGSCYLMSRKHWDWLGGLQNEGYGHLMQESTEIALKTWLGGGKVMVNKNTWYAHRHRKFGRTFRMGPGALQESYDYSKDYWLNNRWEDRIHDFNWLMERFGV